MRKVDSSVNTPRQMPAAVDVRTRKEGRKRERINRKTTKYAHSLQQKTKNGSEQAGAKSS